MRRLLSALSLLLVAGSAAAEEPPFITSRALTPALATEGVMAAIDDCATRGYQVTVALVGRDGELLAFARHPLAGPHTIEVARRKAWTANTFRTATLDLQAREASRFMRDIPGALLIGGGVPVNVGGHIYGAMGVSGAPAEKHPGDVDQACAESGIAAMAETLELAGD
jgi:uncharacterized protein GlcG (DUF336 family)